MPEKMKSKLYYPKEVWELRAFRREIAKLCVALKKLEHACQRLGEAYQEQINQLKEVWGND